MVSRNGDSWIWHGPGAVSPNSGPYLDQDPKLGINTYISVYSCTETSVTVYYAITLENPRDYSSGGYFGYSIKIGLTATNSSYSNQQWVEIINKSASQSTWSSIRKTGYFTYNLSGRDRLSLYITSNCTCSSGEHTSYYDISYYGKAPLPRIPNVTGVSPTLAGSSTTFTIKADPTAETQIQTGYQNISDLPNTWHYNSWERITLSSSGSYSTTMFFPKNRVYNWLQASSRAYNSNYFNPYSDWTVYKLSNGTWAGSGTHSTEDAKVQAKLNPPTSIVLKKNNIDISVNNPLMYGESLNNKIYFINNQYNPDDVRLVNNQQYPIKYLPSGSTTTINNVDNCPKWDNETYVQDWLYRKYYQGSEYSTNTTPKARVKLNIPRKPVLSDTTDLITLSDNNQYYVVTIGNQVTATALETEGAQPTNPKPIYANIWTRGQSSSVTEVISDNSCEIRMNYYKVKTQAIWRDGWHTLLPSDYAEINNYIVVRRCPRGLTSDSNFSSNFHIQKYDGSTYTNLDDSSFDGVLSINDTLYLSIPSYSSSKNLGKFNCYKVEFISRENTATLITIHENDSEIFTEHSLVADIVTLLNNHPTDIIPGKEYKIRVTAGYKKDTAIDDETITEYSWNPMVIDSNNNILESTNYENTNVFESGYVIVGGKPEIPEIIYPYYKSNQTETYVTYNQHPRIIFKVYSTLSEGGATTSGINKVTVKIKPAEFGSEKSYVGIIGTEEVSGIRYFTNQYEETQSGNATIDSFAYVTKDIGYPKLAETSYYPPTGEEYYYDDPAVDNNGNIIYEPLGRSITNGDIIVFEIPNIPNPISDTYTITITINCSSTNGIDSEDKVITLSIAQLPHTIKGTEVVASNVSTAGAVNTGNYLRNIINSYENFIYKTNDNNEVIPINEDIEYILNRVNGYLQDDFEDKIIKPNKTDTLTRTIYSWYLAIRSIYKEVYRRCNAASHVNTVIHTNIQSTANPSVILNKSLYHSFILNLEGKRKFIYTDNNGTYSDKVWCWYIEHDDSDAQMHNHLYPVCSTTTEDKDKYLKHFGIFIDDNVALSEGDYIELVTSEVYSIDVGKIYPENKIIDSELQHGDVIVNLNNNDNNLLYAYYGNGRGYREALLDLIIDLLSTLI